MEYESVHNYHDSKYYFLLEKDFAKPQAKQPLSTQATENVATEYPPIPEDKTPYADTAFHRFMHSPDRVVLPGDEKARKKFLDANPKIKTAVEGKKFIAVRADDIGLGLEEDRLPRKIYLPRGKRETKP